MKRLLLWLTTFFALPGMAQPLWPPRTFSAFYGEIGDETPSQLADFDLLILHPGDENENLNVENIAKLRATGKTKTLVGYVSLGEDDHPPGGPPLQGQNSDGPRFFHKLSNESGAAEGYPGYFLDQRRYLFDSKGYPKFTPSGKPSVEEGQDGHPDENGVWGSYYANAGDPIWRARVFKKLEALDMLGLDGFFLDTIDTASPWGDYGWTSEGMLELVEMIRARYPKKRIIANRGLWYLSQDDRFAKSIDAVLFESLLTEYREETKSATISPWARWHVQALLDDVIPAQKRTGLTLLVLDYLNPEHREAPLLVQSARTLLQAAPQYALSYSHPSLQIPGWACETLLAEPQTADWPTITRMEVEEEARGAFKIEVSFDSPVPTEGLPDLRVTTRDDILPERASELPISQVLSYQANGRTAVVRGNGLDKARAHKFFFRLVSHSSTQPTPFAWTYITSRPSELPGQVTDLTSESSAQGLVLSFSSQNQAHTYRVRRRDESGQETLIAESPVSPVILSDLAMDQAAQLTVTAVDEAGREGYPSLPHVAVLRNVTPADPPGPVTIEEGPDRTLFRWEEVPKAESYRLYVVPQNHQFRLPLVCNRAEATVTSAVPGNYRVFATTVDKDGNQSQPGPNITWTAP